MSVFLNYENSTAMGLVSENKGQPERQDNDEADAEQPTVAY